MANFKFSGHGNFSGCFGWDSGLSHISTEPTTADVIPMIDLWDDVACGASHNVAQTFRNKYGRGYFYLNEHGGSRSVWGELVAFDEVCAQKCVQTMADRLFFVAAYIPEDERGVLY